MFGFYTLFFAEKLELHFKYPLNTWAGQINKNVAERLETWVAILQKKRIKIDWRWLDQKSILNVTDKT